jgi:hypothetical protein
LSESLAAAFQWHGSSTRQCLPWMILLTSVLLSSSRLAIHLELVHAYIMSTASKPLPPPCSFSFFFDGFLLHILFIIGWKNILLLFILHHRVEEYPPPLLLLQPLRCCLLIIMGYCGYNHWYVSKRFLYYSMTALTIVTFYNRPPSLSTSCRRIYTIVGVE